MGIQYTPPKVEELSPRMQALIAELKAIRENPLSKPMNLDDFNFKKCREALKHYKGSLSDAVIEERREGEDA